MSQYGCRPLYKTPEEFEAALNDYLEKCKEEDKHPIITELALHMGFASRQSIHDYAQKEGFKEVTSRARLICESVYERQLANGRGDGGVIFALKNAGWSDKQELDHTSSDGSMRPSTIQLVGPDDESAD